MKRVQDIPVHYGMNAFALYSEMRKVSMNDALNLDPSKMDLMDFFTLMYVGVKEGARVAKEECKFGSVEDLLDYADENADVINDIAQVFSEYGKGEGSKKK